jgi:hypothetical protein
MSSKGIHSKNLKESRGSLTMVLDREESSSLGLQRKNNEYHSPKALWKPREDSTKEISLPGKDQHWTEECLKAGTQCPASHDCLTGDLIRTCSRWSLPPPTDSF